jgi:diguanylate cyclase (GGDEF)-like protein
VQTDQFAVLAALVVAANLVLLGALLLPRLRGASTRSAAPEAGQQEAIGPDDGRDPESPVSALYERVVRVVAQLFIGAALVVITVSGQLDRPVIYVVLALGAFLIVLGQDVLPARLLGRWRFGLEALAAVLFVSALVYLTGGHDSPFFFGYVLLLAAASLWSSGVAPLLLSLASSAAYLAAVLLAPNAVPMSVDVAGRLALNLVALALISYLASVIAGEHRQAREAALRLSHLDQMTRLFNRGHVRSALDQEIRRAARTNRPFAVLMVDLDDLKPVNDRFGHDAGDRLLRAVAGAVRNGIRATDTAARYGGDEFLLVLPETDLDGALRVAEKLRADIGRLAVSEDGSSIRISASFGLVTYPDDGRTADELIRRADLAMYEAKRRGRDQVVRYARQGPPKVALSVGDRSPWPDDVGQRTPAGSEADEPMTDPFTPPAQSAGGRHPLGGG